MNTGRHWILAICGMACVPAFGDTTDPLAELSRMTLEQLAAVEVTSVSKAPQSAATAPATLYVITHDEGLEPLRRRFERLEQSILDRKRTD